MICIDSCLDYCKCRPMEPDRAGAASRTVRAERAARASTPGVQAELVKHPRKLGREAKAKMRQLQRNRPKSEDLEELQKWEEEVLVVKEELRKSGHTRLAFGFPFVDPNGVWQNLRTDTPASFSMMFSSAPSPSSA